MFLTALTMQLALALAPPAVGFRSFQIGGRRSCQHRPPRRRPRGRRHLRLGPGGLRAHEDRYGHCCRRHVGRTPQQMFTRLRRTRRLRYVSTFPNMKLAQKVLRETLNQNSAVLARWYRAGNPGSMAIRGRFNYAIGTYVTRGSPRLRKSYRSYFLLVGNQHWPGGFRIITGYPVP